MARFNSSKLRSAINRYNQSVRRHNSNVRRMVNEYNRSVRRYNDAIRVLKRCQSRIVRTERSVVIRLVVWQALSQEERTQIEFEAASERRDLIFLDENGYEVSSDE